MPQKRRFFSRTFCVGVLGTSFLSLSLSLRFHLHFCYFFFVTFPSLSITEGVRPARLPAHACLEPRCPSPHGLLPALMIAECFAECNYWSRPLKEDVLGWGASASMRTRTLASCSALRTSRTAVCALQAIIYLSFFQQKNEDVMKKRKVEVIPCSEGQKYSVLS